MRNYRIVTLCLEPFAGWQRLALLMYADFSFYPRDATLARYVAIIACLSVRLYVCHKPVLYQNGYTTDLKNNAAQAQIGRIVLWCKRSPQNCDGIRCRCWNYNFVFLPVEKSPVQTHYHRKFMSIRHGGPRRWRCTGGGIRGVINNFGCRRSLLIIVTVQLTSTRLVVSCMEVCGPVHHCISLMGCRFQMLWVTLSDFRVWWHRSS